MTTRTLPRLHIVTNDEVLRMPDFLPTAARLLERFGARIALHVRGHATPTRELFEAARALREVTAATGGRLFVNDRIDVALTVGADGVQLGARSLPPSVARKLLPDAWIGQSVNAAAAAGSAAGMGTDLLVVGTIYATASHPERAGDGPEAIGHAVAAAAGVPVIAIGGVTAPRVAEIAAAGGYGIAVIGGVWHAPDPIAAAGGYQVALETAYGKA
jgi:thiamine-phosphate diphosphorylase